ncbi:DsbA family protein [Rhizobium alvei]|uniref:DsbA family protein n=1 Tax=Rhizobium alvei TaxID=1132659 RepID=A0ABT8YH85_9HYPH|nr:DsbA family protein [Rhizobium alvei]MDO6963049.1 DsbA family protein [Rhizobium alvei]
MTLKTLISSSALALVALLAPVAPASALDDAQKKEIGEFIREYLIEHPEVMIEVQQALEMKQYQARLKQAEVAVQENHAEIFTSANDMSLGNPNGKITIVEFFDYNCGYCKRAMSDMDTIIKSNPDVRFVLKELPILGPASVAAHKVSNAFRKIAPEKYADFHRMLLGSEERADEDVAIEVATSLGVSEEKLRAEMAKDDDSDAQATELLARKLGISGTPSYVVGNEAIFGAIGAEAINQKIANVGQCGKTTC